MTQSNLPDYSETPYSDYEPAPTELIAYYNNHICSKPDAIVMTFSYEAIIRGNLKYLCCKDIAGAYAIPSGYDNLQRESPTLLGDPREIYISNILDLIAQINLGAMSEEALETLRACLDLWRIEVLAYYIGNDDIEEV